MTRRLIGFDPGSRLCGWGVVEVDGQRVAHVDNGVIVLPAKKPLTERIGALVPRWRLIATYRPQRRSGADHLCSERAPLWRLRRCAGAGGSVLDVRPDHG